MRAASPRILLIDGNNVMGAVADGWWRDRPGAMLRLLQRVRCYAGTTKDQVALVWDVPQPDLPAGDQAGVVVHYATRRGPDAADDRIIELLGASAGAIVEVVTSDRILSQRARDLGAGVTGAGRFLQQLRDAGC